MLGFKTDYHFMGTNNTLIEQIENTTELGVFVKYKYNHGKLILEPSFRMQWYASLSSISPEPRLAAKYNATEHFRIKFASGLYSQNLISARSDNDVVNLFTASFPAPTICRTNLTEKILPTTCKS